MAIAAATAAAIRTGIAVAALTAALLAPRAAEAAGSETRVAVMEFTSAGNDSSLDQLGKGLQSMITTDLANVQSLTVVERARLRDIETELKLAHGVAFDSKTAARIGKLAGATHLFVGSFTVVGDTMRLDGRLIAVATGRVLIAEQAAGEKALFFELEQKLVQQVIALLGVKLAPKERAALLRPHTADFQAFQKFSEGLQAFDDGRLDAAVAALNAATALDKDFKLASLTLDEYEKLAAGVRAKASAAGQVEHETRRLEKNQALAAELAVVKKLWPILEQAGNTADIKLRRVAAACVLANHYRSEFGFRSRGPVTGEDLDAAGFDRFTLDRTADALTARAWAEAPEVFPRVPPLCFGFGVVSADSRKDIATELGYQIERAAKLAGDREALISYMDNNASVDPVAEALGLDPPGEVRLWTKLYDLAQKLPQLKDAERVRFETHIAELRRRAGDFDGSTQMYAAASRHSKDSYQLREYATAIEDNKRLRQVVGPDAPTGLREAFLLQPSRGASELARLTGPGSAKPLASALQSGRDISERERVIFAGVPTWRLIGPTFGALVRSGRRTSLLATDELRYEGWSESSRGASRPPAAPVVFVTSVRTKRPVLRATLDASAAPADWRADSRPPPPGGGEAGVVFAIRRIVASGGIHEGAPPLAIATAVLVGPDRVRLVQILRDGEHRISVAPLGEAAIAPARGGRRALEVVVESGSVAVTVDGKRSAFAWKPDDDGDGFTGFLFNGVGYASISGASIAAR
jgi:TolB-like protein